MKVLRVSPYFQFGGLFPENVYTVAIIAAKAARNKKQDEISSHQVRIMLGICSGDIRSDKTCLSRLSCIVSLRGEGFHNGTGFREIENWLPILDCFQFSVASASSEIGRYCEAVLDLNDMVDL